MSSMWQTLRRAVSQQQAAAQASPGGGAPQPLAAATPSPADTPPPPSASATPQPAAPPPPLSIAAAAPAAPAAAAASPAAQQAASTATTHQASSLSEHPVQRSISLPAPSHHVRPLPTPRGPTVSLGDDEQQRTRRPQYARSMSRTEIVKKFIKRETAVFFGVEESCEREQQERWLNRRRRLAARKYGALRDDHQPARTPSTPRTPTTSAYTTQQSRDSSRPDVLPLGRGLDSTDALSTPRWSEPPVRRKESVAQMTFGGLAVVVTTLMRHKSRPQPRSHERARSFALSDVPESVSGDEETPITLGEDEVFFDKPLLQAATVPVAAQSEGEVAGLSRAVQAEGGFVASRDQLDHVQLDAQYYTQERAPSWRRTPERMETASESGPEVGCSRIWTRVLDRVFDNSDRRTYGMGVMGKFFGRSIKNRVAARQDIKEQLEDMEDYRPFFTYWVTTVQVLILIISLACYGLGPVGINLNHRSGQVLVTSLSLQQVDYQEPANFWIGPRAADLIHLGAKFAPCMRKDAKIIKEIEKGREKERETACCIRNDDSGCVQSSQADCSNTISTWKKWSAGEAGPGGRISGSVCGLDPKFCEAPASVAPYEWPDDITKWPICRKTNSRPQQRSPHKDKIAEHMVCEVIGHPCCIGIHGMCRITTKEYCEFVRGYFHEEASLCSQVSCLDDVCGMVPFYSPETPDQFYRLWTSLFLHAGVFQLLITLMIQYFLMRDLEKLTGSLRIMIIYMGSGVAGNLASAIFVPYRADVGPAGAQFGLLACLIVEVLNAWMMLKHPEQALLKLVSITLLLFLVGILPWVDNYSHLFGFIFGFLLSYALMPFLSFGEYDRQKKIALVWVCLLSALFLFVALIVLFYVIPVYDCEVCSYFNCVPLTRDFCASQNINFMREEPVV